MAVMSIQHGMSKTQHYSVRWNPISNEISDACINRDLPAVGEHCAHQLAFTELLFRISQGFEQVEYNGFSRVLFDNDAHVRLLHLSEALLEKEYIQLLVSECSRQKVSDTSSKYHYLRKVLKVDSVDCEKCPNKDLSTKGTKLDHFAPYPSQIAPHCFTSTTSSTFTIQRTNEQSRTLHAQARETTWQAFKCG